ncbi:MAG: nucleoside recognition domain-containing protein [Clostridiales bacterium]|nr:nucleoside recognition domain-containing protein [Clostridiales bacterium]
MMKWIFACMIIISTLFGALNGRIGDVSNALIQGSGNAVTLVISLMGAMCLWSGVMKVADEAGLTDMVAKLLSPITKRLFRGLDTDSPAMKAISMNITANLLGLGNAATPLGIEAMRRMAEDENIKDTASNNMVTFVVLNTASIQLIPTTISVLRLNHGAAAPMDILPAILLSSVVSLSFGVMISKILGYFHAPEHHKRFCGHHSKSNTKG